VIDVLVTKTNAAAQAHHVTAVHLTGGVSANRGLRQAMRERLAVPVHYPPLLLCTDNAAMIAAAGHYYYQQQRFSSLNFDVIPSLQLQ
jgi:N6-L-threonylcarbamoyladenine synthase